MIRQPPNNNTTNKIGAKHPSSARSPQPRGRFRKSSSFMSIAKQMFSGGNTKTVRTSTPHAFGKVDFTMFFNLDNAKVVSALDKKEFRVLSRTGSWTRGAMRRSIRKGGKKGKPSTPGNPPKYWSRGMGSLKDGIFFVANLNAGGVIVGPNRLRTSVSPGGGLASSAELLERGGSAVMSIQRDPTRRRSRRNPTLRRVRGNWKARPYAAPLQPKAQDKLAEFIETTPL